jgi:hypothetical protein
MKTTTTISPVFPDQSHAAFFQTEGEQVTSTIGIVKNRKKMAGSCSIFQAEGRWTATTSHTTAPWTRPATGAGK